ncbi:iron(III) transport system ATP-binding protein [Desulfohalotomaculum tongense]|uniref:ABC transporter ATP-binding protein n=1 Tax=Desulforadius tongensis TaxID=1216062 RepID=UPI00195B5838|nr:ABC transporter ATP-binding protein [Desulforadius tongensis]MBM7855651.1 iron(III) transport system ATP-binding protein [Desulforadius tongensis]
MSVIKMDNVTKRYNGSPKPAVKYFSVMVEKGEILALLGPSGCGKTTTLRLIAGFETLDEGAIYINGKVVSSKDVYIPVEKRGIGMVFQDYALFPHLTVGENIIFGLKQGKQKRKERLQQLLELVNLEGYENRFPHQLSGGQQQRVALARALARDPVVLLMDEPFSNLDAELRYEMREEIKQIVKSTGVTTVLVTHDQQDALSVADKMVIMNQGVIEQYGTPYEIYHNPISKFVAGFLVKSNLLPAKVQNNILETPLGKFPLPGECKAQHGWLSIGRDQIIIEEQGKFNAQVAACNFAGQYTEVRLKVDGLSGELICYQSASVPLYVNQWVRFSVKSYQYIAGG